jgi:hypothetical protein
MSRGVSVESYNPEDGSFYTGRVTRTHDGDLCDLLLNHGGVEPKIPRFRLYPIDEQQLLVQVPKEGQQVDVFLPPFEYSWWQATLLSLVDNPSLFLCVFRDGDVARLEFRDGVWRITYGRYIPVATPFIARPTRRRW